MVWDPWLIVAQIACLQSLFYLSLGVFLWLFVGSHVPRFTLKYFFDYSVLSPSSFVGWCCIFAFLANAFVGAFYLVVVVERTKKYLDFAAMVHLLHVLLCLLDSHCARSPVPLSTSPIHTPYVIPSSPSYQRLLCGGGGGANQAVPQVLPLTTFPPIPHSFPRRFPSTSAFYLVVVVERTKKCLDFAATVHLLHALLCLLYAHVPSSFSFWLTSFLSCLLMTLLGEWLVESSLSSKQSTYSAEWQFPP
ncbi:unnamed protein product [Closterium sp. Naga37s-1]|nr:unnamed protein product [Closterium sp. Naga37s-1]